MSCEICGIELTDNTVSDVDPYKCSNCAPAIDEEDFEEMEEGDLTLDDSFDINIEL